MNFYKLLLLFSLFSILPDVGFSKNIGKDSFLFKVSKIKFEGLERVKENTILNQIRSKPGIRLTKKILNEDINSLFKLNYFEKSRHINEEKY